MRVCVQDEDAEEEKRRVAGEAAMLPMENTAQMISSLNCWLLWIGVENMTDEEVIPPLASVEGAQRPRL
eukprot:COSAG06_NODE_43058_length_375_cov_2.210145_1_plen_69_part_00